MFPRGGHAGETAIKLTARLGSVFGANIPKLGFTSLSDKTLSEYLVGHSSYPARSVLRLVKLMESTRSVIKRVNAPILIVQSRRDDVIWKNSGKHVFDSVKSQQKKLIQLENSRHKAPIDRDRHILFEEISRFVVACAKQSTPGPK